MTILKGDALDLIKGFDRPVDLVVTDPPYAFSGSGIEHAISATVAIVLRECASKIVRGGWMLVFCATSWRSTMYMAEAVRGILTPVRIATWCKPVARSKVSTAGWGWASVNIVAMRKGKSRPMVPGICVDHITCSPVTSGRRAELPVEVAEWAVSEYALDCGIFLDPFAGSGTLVRAAEGLGMDSYGFEKE